MHVHLCYMSLIGALESVRALSSGATPSEVPILDIFTYTVHEKDEKGGLFSKRKKAGRAKNCRVESRDKKGVFEFQIGAAATSKGMPADEAPSRKLSLTSAQYGELRSHQLGSNPLPNIEIYTPNPTCGLGVSIIFSNLYRADEKFRDSVDIAQKPVAIDILIRHLMDIVPTVPPILKGIVVERITDSNEPEKLHCRATTTDELNTLELSVSRDKSTITADDLQLGKRKAERDGDPFWFEFDQESTAMLKDKMVKDPKNVCGYVFGAFYDAFFNGPRYNLTNTVIDVPFSKGEKKTIETIFFECLFNKIQKNE